MLKAPISKKSGLFRELGFSCRSGIEDYVKKIS